MLKRLAASPHRPTLVVTPPDRPRGRGRRLRSPPAAEAARELGISVEQTENVNEEGVVRRIRAASPEVACVCGFGQLIREPLLDSPLLLNAHPSLLPRWRGAAPIERAIMAGDPVTGVSVMRITAGLDSGPVALQERLRIEPGEDFGSLAPRLAELSGELLVRALDLHARDELEFHDQDEGLATYADKVGPHERRLDPACPASELAARVRALTPHIGAYVELPDGDRLGVRAVAAQDGELGPGELSAEGAELRLGCGEGVLRLDLVQPPGGRPMRAADFLRGHELPSRLR